jgi:uncharacterized protein YpmB
MNKRQIFMLMAVILIVAIAGYAYLHSRQAAPLQDASPEAAGVLHGDPALHAANLA